MNLYECMNKSFNVKIYKYMNEAFYDMPNYDDGVSIKDLNGAYHGELYTLHDDDGAFREYADTMFHCNGSYDYDDLNEATHNIVSEAVSRVIANPDNYVYFLDELSDKARDIISALKEDCGRSVYIDAEKYKGDPIIYIDDVDEVRRTIGNAIEEVVGEWAEDAYAQYAQSEDDDEYDDEDDEDEDENENV